MPVEPGKQFLQFVKERGLILRRGDSAPATLPEWESQKSELRSRLLKSWGGFPSAPCELNPQKLGELQRDGYVVERVVFQTRPGVWMTANAYVPAGGGKRPAVLCVHGHWKGAKQDPVVQTRCIGLVKLGFFVLAVDAFGAGERGISKNLGEYHGEMVASTLWPVGLPLSGLQVYENMRAVDYLATRPEVEITQLGITGASGGGNQTMYAGAFDERFNAVVPVCSVGTYQAYLGAACCMCEMVPKALTFTEEAGILAMVAPRALMVINATRDAFQFSVGEAQKSIAAAQHVFRLYGKAGKISHDLFESPHDYGKAMREAMYGWMTLHLKGEGLGNPIPEPSIQTEDPESLRCYPGTSRPDDFMTIPRFAAVTGKQLLSKWETDKIAHAEHWEATAERISHTLTREIFGGWPERTVPEVQTTKAQDGSFTTYLVTTEPGIEVAAISFPGKSSTRKVAIVIDLEGVAHANQSDIVKQYRERGWETLIIEPRATGRYAVAGDQILRAPDHNSAEWAMWIGRPLVGQWIWDVRQVLQALSDSISNVQEISIVGIGASCLIALGTALHSKKIQSVKLINPLVSFVTDAAFEKQWVGTLPPNILRDVGDVPQIAALVAPRPLTIVGGQLGNGATLAAANLNSAFAYTEKVYNLLQASSDLRILPSVSAEAVQE